MKAYEATSEIQASPEAIWAILVDGAMPDLGPSFSQFARGLKARAERSAGA